MHVQHFEMGTTQSRSHKPKFQKLYMVIDLYLKSEFDNELNLDVLKTNDDLKKILKNIILNALVTNGHYIVLIDNANLWLVSGMDKNGVKYLELNAVAEFYECKTDRHEISDNLRRIEHMKLNILSEFFTYTSKQRNIIVSPDTTLVLLYNTLYNIAVKSDAPINRRCILKKS